MLKVIVYVINHTKGTKLSDNDEHVASYWKASMAHSQHSMIIGSCSPPYDGQLLEGLGDARHVARGDDAMQARQQLFCIHALQAVPVDEQVRHDAG